MVIRGPAHPLQREGLRRLLRDRSDLIERGLQVLAEDLELATADLGPVDALLRDAGGAPVLALITEPGDRALVARALAAQEFWRRNRDAMARALPEVDLRPGASCRLLVLGTAIAPAMVEALQRLPFDDLAVLEAERFHVGEQERMVVRSLVGRGCAGPDPIDAAVGGDVRQRLDSLATKLRHLDAKIVLYGDRFSRRASCSGRLLCEFWFAADRVHATIPGEPARELASDRDVRAFADQVARRHLAQVRGGVATTARPEAHPAPRAGAFDALWQSMSQARLSREECSALGEVAEEDPLPGS